MNDLLQTAERHSGTRAWLMVSNALFLVFFSTWLAGDSAFHGVRHLAWPVLTASSLAMLVTGGYLLKPRAVLALMNDELSIQNRADAIRFALISAAAIAFVLYGFANLQPLDTLAALRLPLGLGVAAGLLRYAWLERR